ncbi:MAG: hypothetical protein CVU15_09275 [Betaproteobacteria bacterium HGW-Betaproteobacteria-1]|jgi:hypothetical protein|nr:MAG: hypothetical protein CVU15_09275 [Betaproteobacteria bacterium HGW-Betaproteobacteria-1]
MIEGLIAAFQTDPLKTLLGSGGILGLVVIIGRWFWNRPRVNVKLIQETFDIKGNPNVEVTLTVEFENHGRENTSFETEAKIYCLTADREVLQFVLMAETQTRTLSPVTPQQITFKGQVAATYIYSHFRIIKFKLSRGGEASIRVLNASGQLAGRIKFFFLKVLFKVFGVLPHVQG